jgi:hypothetical protein
MMRFTIFRGIWFIGLIGGLLTFKTKQPLFSFGIAILLLVLDCFAYKFHMRNYNFFEYDDWH